MSQDRTHKRSAGGNQYLDLAILGLLNEEAQHGYELHRRIIASFQSLFQPSWGSLYPALSRLERLGMIEATSPVPARPQVPSTGSLSGELALFRAMATASTSRRQKKQYAITSAGREHFEVLLINADVADDRSFWVSLAFSERLPRPRQSTLVNKRRYLMEDRLREIKESPIFGQSGSRSVALGGLAQRISHEVDWLEDLAGSLGGTEADRLPS